MALGALHAIRVHRLRVPEDISVIGIDDIAMAAHTNPPLTTIAQPKYRMGRVAMRTLRQMIQGQPPPEDGYTLMESPLIVRESTGPAPVKTRMDITHESWERFATVARGGQADRVPVALIVDSPWLPGYAGINTLDFFLREDEWLRIYLG